MAPKDRYPWQHPSWPNFIFDPGPSQDTVLEYTKLSREVYGGVAQLSQASMRDVAIDIMVSEALNTSEIEGEKINPENVRSSIKNYLGIGSKHEFVMDPQAEGIAALMVDVQSTLGEPLTEDTLHRWHSLIMHGEDELKLTSRGVVVGSWRVSGDPMQVVSGPIGRERVHYEAPPCAALANEMKQFLTWYNNPSYREFEGRQPLRSAVYRAGIAHLWFECIHPYGDGNGRVGRAIVEHALGQDLGIGPLMSLSSHLNANKKSYYEALHRASHFNLDVTDWITYFADSVYAAQKDAQVSIDFVFRKSRFWASHSDTHINARQKKCLDRVFKEGPGGFSHGISPKKYTAITQCGSATATRDLTDLVNKGVMTRTVAGRSTRYFINF